MKVFIIQLKPLENWWLEDEICPFFGDGPCSKVTLVWGRVCIRLDKSTLDILVIDYSIVWIYLYMSYIEKDMCFILYDVVWCRWWTKSCSSWYVTTPTVWANLRMWLLSQLFTLTTVDCRLSWYLEVTSLSTSKLGGGNSNIFLIFTPYLGERIQFD